MYFMGRHAGVEPLYLVAGTGAGKTTFLRNDLMPLANGAKDGSLAVYIGLATDRDNPLDVILNAIYREIDDLKKQPWSRVVSAANSTVESLEIAGTAIKFGAGATPRPSSQSGLIQLDRAIGELKRLAKKPVLLVIDDAHLLLRAPDVGALCTCLRATISGDPGNINAIFALDSHLAADSLFNRKGAPFWKFGRQAKFPPVNETFVDTMCALYETETGIKLDLPSMREAFEAVFRQPRAMLSLIGQMAADSSDNPRNYIIELRAEVMQEDDWTDVHNSLSVLQQAIVRRVAMGQSPTGPEALQAYAHETLKSRVSPATVERELKPLVEQRICLELDGRWRIADENYYHWIIPRLSPAALPAPRGTANVLTYIAPQLG